MPDAGSNQAAGIPGTAGDSGSTRSRNYSNKRVAETRETSGDAVRSSVPGETAEREFEAAAADEMTCCKPARPDVLGTTRADLHSSRREEISDDRDPARGRTAREAEVVDMFPRANPRAGQQCFDVSVCAADTSRFALPAACCSQHNLPAAALASFDPRNDRHGRRRRRGRGHHFDPRPPQADSSRGPHKRTRCRSRLQHL